jgi:hypothetical protein
MREALGVVVILLVFVGVLLVGLWPLRTIVQSAKVRGVRKFAWVILYHVGFMLGGFASYVIWTYMRIFFVLIPIVGLLPVWTIYAIFRSRTRNLPDLPSNARPIGFALGKGVRALLNRWK